jgi:hypothetical protein
MLLIKLYIYNYVDAMKCYIYNYTQLCIRDFFG